MEGPAAEQVVVRTDRYEVATASVGDYLVVRLRGTYADALLDDLRNRVFRARSSFAIDASRLLEYTPAFSKELQYTAQLLKATHHRLVLLNPPERLRSTMSLLSGGAPLAVFKSEEELLAGRSDTDRRLLHESKELSRILDQLRSDRRWQMADREGLWICPFCGAPQPDVVIPSFASVPTATAEKAYRHLWNKCARYAPMNPQVLPLEEIEAAMRRANQEKIVVSKRQMSALETRLTSLEDKARRGDALAESVRIASDRQRRLLPARAPDLPGAEIGIVYRPAEHVSGDFYDFVPMDDGKTGFIIGDVSGHGIEAGILMGMAKKVLVMRLEEYADPVDAILKTNADLFRELDRLSFVTAVVAVYDPSERTLTVGRAGHNPPVIFNAMHDPDHELVEPSGTGLGLTKDMAFEDALEKRIVPVRSGDLFLLYTDGLVEARSAKHEEFGIERVVSLLRAELGSPTPFLLSSLSNELDRFMGGRPQEDDVTAVAVRFQ